MSKFCPCCGYDLVANQPILLNDFAMLSPSGQLTWRGEPTNLTEFERQICWTLLKAYPEPVRNTVILERCGSEGLPDNVKVHIHYIRKKLAAVGAPNPIKPKHFRNGGGYMWVL